ncbi:MAG: DNA-directed RNA polymerase subunit alpha [Planctomycetes bacterium]|nr:DNA-directed RNA polymerase subunit alpha [Planctomycetota bacterium]MBM4078163.1 DNA-directed RNA polymerase subunit alpha [Planctomycetota bacterium]MBM4083376.1 DNA-directed RNA polymerase subunit alpha [Planctomycetota bacterium]
MRIRWRGFELPTRVACETETLTDKYGKFIAEPFERGYGTTVGNSLRRVLLSSLEGSAVSSVKFGGVLHEFSTVPGVVEDVTDIVLNIKGIVVKLYTDEPKRIRIEASKKGPVKAGDIITDANVEIMNKDHHIATLSEDAKFTVEMDVRKGRGYVTAEENSPEEQIVGLIPVDSIFSPVQRVRYKIEETRVGQRTNYDKLILEVWTNGTLAPEMALVEASKILRKHLNPFVQYFELGRELQVAEKSVEMRAIEDSGLKRKLDTALAELDLSVRAANCLEAANLKTIRDLVQLSEAELLEIKNLGKTTLKELKKKLAELDLTLGVKASSPTP